MKTTVSYLMNAGAYFLFFRMPNKSVKVMTFRPNDNKIRVGLYKMPELIKELKS